MMRVAVLHDYFDKYGGGEKTAIIIAKALDADIITGFVDEKNTFPELRGSDVTEISGKPFVPVLQLMKKFGQLRLDYDLFIFSGTACIAANHNRPSIWHCHTPARYLYDLKEWYEKNSNPLQRVALRSLRRIVLPKDQAYARRFDSIVVNSDTVQKRVKKYYGMPSRVIRQPVEIRKFRYRPSDGYYLSPARLDRLKRVDVIVRAFARMPDRKLVIMSSGPARAAIEKLARGHDNITVKGWVSEKERTNLLSRCIASIYIPINEDSGVTPVESMASGKPCIVPAEGGTTESVIDGKTGLHIAATEEGVIRAVSRMTEDKARSMRSACIRQSKKFSDRIFAREIRKEAARVVG